MPVRLFVGGLSYSTSSERLRETFARFGSVASAIVMNDRETGRSRGFAFVEMESPADAEKAISGLNGSSLDGRMIRVDMATPRGTGRVAPRGPGSERGGFPDRRSSGPSERPWERPSPGWAPPPGGGGAGAPPRRSRGAGGDRRAFEDGRPRKSGRPSVRRGPGDERGGRWRPGLRGDGGYPENWR